MNTFSILLLLFIACVDCHIFGMTSTPKHTDEIPTEVPLKQYEGFENHADFDAHKQKLQDLWKEVPRQKEFKSIKEQLEKILDEFHSKVPQTNDVLQLSNSAKGQTVYKFHYAHMVLHQKHKH